MTSVWQAGQKMIHALLNFDVIFMRLNAALDKANKSDKDISDLCAFIAFLKR